MKLNKEREAEALGGSDIEFRLEYESNDASPYFNKENHFKRSLCHQPNHKRVAKKIKLLEEGHELSF